MTEAPGATVPVLMVQPQSQIPSPLRSAAITAPVTSSSSSTGQPRSLREGEVVGVGERAGVDEVVREGLREPAQREHGVVRLEVDAQPHHVVGHARRARRRGSGRGPVAVLVIEVIAADSGLSTVTA